MAQVEEDVVVEDLVQKPAHLYTNHIIDRLERHGEPAIALCGYVRTSLDDFKNRTVDEISNFCPKCFALQMEGK